MKLKGTAMSEKKIKVPEGMLKAAREATRQWLLTEVALEAALRWLSENPIVPTDEQYSDLSAELVKYNYSLPSMKFAAIEWQRRMFLASEPEIPEEVRDFHAWAEVYFGSHPELENIKDNFMKAYRRGKESR